MERVFQLFSDSSILPSSPRRDHHAPVTSQDLFVGSMPKRGTVKVPVHFQKTRRSLLSPRTTLLWVTFMSTNARKKKKEEGRL